MEMDYTVLLSDDDLRYSNSLVETAAEFGIDLVHFTDWESAYSSLVSDPDRFDAIILDGKGRLTDDDPGGNIQHITKALNDINELRGSGIILPVVINTAYLAKMSEIISGEKILPKGDEKILLEYIINQIKGTPEYKVRSKFKDVFEIFDDIYLPKESSKRLVNILLLIEAKELSNIEDLLFNPVRKLLESIYKRLHELDENLIPYSCVSFGDRVRLDWCYFRLLGKDVIDSREIVVRRIPRVLPKYLGPIVKSITDLTNIQSHDSNDAISFSCYTIHHVIYGLMDTLIWFKIYVDENYNAN